MMKRQSISLPDEHWAALEKRADKLGISTSEMIRWIVEKWREGNADEARRAEIARKRLERGENND